EAGRSSSSPLPPIDTAVYLQDEMAPSTAAIALARVRQSGAKFVRLVVYWSQIAPARRPAHFDAADPADRAYHWRSLDRDVKHVTAAHLQVMLTVLGAPAGAERASSGRNLPGNPRAQNPGPSAYALFPRAIPTRQSGHFHGLPRVRYWLAWNEPDLSLYMVPQLVNRRPVSPSWYRQMVNGFANAVHGVAPDNVVVAGETAPFRDNSQYVMGQNKDWG